MQAGAMLLTVLVSALIACSQATHATLSAELREHVALERFNTVTSIRGLPLGVRGALQSLFASQEFDVQRDIADPGARFQGTGDLGDPSLPLRRLVAAECSLDHCFVCYERAGRPSTWYVALFHWAPDATRFESGGLAAARIGSIADARNALLSGTIKASPAFW